MALAASGCQSGYWRLYKLLWGTCWRLQNGWSGSLPCVSAEGSLSQLWAGTRLVQPH